jgi:hypothetical protein
MTTERISQINDLQVHVHKTNPPMLHVIAKGTASSGSHQNARLERRIYIIFPEDGFQEYDFVVDVPDGPTTDDIKTFTSENQWENFPNELKGISVYAKTNRMEKPI